MESRFNPLLCVHVVRGHSDPTLTLPCQLLPLHTSLNPLHLSCLHSSPYTTRRRLDLTLGDPLRYSDTYITLTLTLTLTLIPTLTLTLTPTLTITLENNYTAITHIRMLKRLHMEDAVIIHNKLY